MIILSFDELVAIARPRYLLRPMIEMGNVGMLFGPSELGKTFVTLDLALSVATGRPWATMPTRSLPVIYVSAEGGDAIGRRVRAWYLDAVDHCTTDEERQELVAGLTAHFRVIPHAVQITEPAQRDELIGEVRDLFGPEAPIGLIVLDTLARNALDLEENSNTDMGRFVSACYDLRSALKVAPQAPGEDEEAEEVDGGPVILIVHHTGKQEVDEHGVPIERGASALRAGMDFVLALNGGPPLRLIPTKLKDGSKPKPLAISWSEPVQVGYDWDEGKPISSIVARVHEPGSALSPGEEKAIAKEAERSELDRTIIDAILVNPNLSIRDLAVELDVSRTKVGVRMKRLQKIGAVTRRQGCYYVAPPEGGVSLSQ